MQISPVSPLASGNATLLDKDPSHNTAPDMIANFEETAECQGHVISALIAPDGRFTVTFADGTHTPGTLVGANAGYDLAVVKVDKSNLPTVPLGSSATRALYASEATPRSGL